MVLIFDSTSENVTHAGRRKNVRFVTTFKTRGIGGGQPSKFLEGIEECIDYMVLHSNDNTYYLGYNNAIEIKEVTSRANNINLTWEYSLASNKNLIMYQIIYIELKSPPIKLNNNKSK